MQIRIVSVFKWDALLEMLCIHDSLTLSDYLFGVVWVLIFYLNFSIPLVICLGQYMKGCLATPVSNHSIAWSDCKVGNNILYLNIFLKQVSANHSWFSIGTACQKVEHVVLLRMSCCLYSTWERLDSYLGCTVCRSSLVCQTVELH